MAETKTAQQQVREQFKVAENSFQSAFRAWNDITAATADANLDMAEKGLRYAQEARGQFDRIVQESLANYRRVQAESLKAWQGYVQNVNEIVNRSY
jgi:hypothetical protein